MTALHTIGLFVVVLLCGIGLSTIAILASIGLATVRAAVRDVGIVDSLIKREVER